MQEKLDLIPAIGTPNTPAVTVAEQMQNIFRSLATLQSGDTRPAGIKNGEFWCRDIDGDKKNFKWYRYIEEQVEDEIVGKDIEVIPMFFVQSISDSKTAREDVAPSEKAVALELENYVDKTSSQELQNKTFLTERAIFASFKSNNISVNPTSGARKFSNLQIFDKDDKPFGYVSAVNETDGSNTIAIGTYDDTGTRQAILRVNNNKGVVTATAPNPPDDSNTDHIATTAWVKKKAINSSGVVKLKGTRTTTGTWTLTRLVVGKPLFIQLKTVNLNATVRYKIVSGTNETTDILVMGHTTFATPGTQVIIPTATAVSIEIELIGSGVSLSAYQ